MYRQLSRFSYKETLKVLEADIQYANTLASAIPRAKGGACLQMKIAYNHLTPFFLFLLQWIDSTCACLVPCCSNLVHILVYKVYADGRTSFASDGRKATIKDFYAVILPSLQQLQTNLVEIDSTFEKNLCKEIFDRMKFNDINLDREDECGICMETCTKMVLPNCCHSMCINCYHDWNTRSESCPFCRGSLKRVSSGDLWVLTSNGDSIDPEIVAKDELSRFYMYVNKLPRDISEAIFLMYYEYLL
ncbi:hypothetical protein MKW98_030399 [Papaver atlanticum]|uniref:RING-type domain-containing protein n=1 Tax=Papaver atlanticum TaxID=357466 RepID=A0AAD4SU36_9MAGN|nr:hypothetical protein MKW98_030399 [Papaver atlanticum]